MIYQNLLCYRAYISSILWLVSWPDGKVGCDSLSLIFNHLEEPIDKLKYTPKYVYDPKSRAQSFGFRAAGNPIPKTVALDVDSLQATS